ncbi:hypothetical protein OG456_48055 [Streptomyces sp. NBC_01446]|uniref:hypothetical protein n=1 Tax=Streptomyces sp. NBC_00120 TaxID=2975660 RepID=UPI0022566589|nr:hypothetical protein [Streptomyces sp. NBC_00120]MCX4649876.1 hypothetical protein [Streptomyces sp. NBC_01446]MCX5320911.1 hypothetical protein [Streptomyces sp. NBC_00120]
MPRLALADLYLCHSVLAPDAGIEAYLTQIDAWLGRGRWRKKGDATWSKGGPARHRPPRRRAPVGRRADRDIPPGFRSVDVVILSDEFEVSRTVRQLPWKSNRALELRGPAAVCPCARSVNVPGGRLAGALCRHPQGPSVRRLHRGRLTRLRLRRVGLVRAGGRGRLRWRDG